MEIEILKKKLSTYRDRSGRVRKVSDELLLEILSSWESWAGPTLGFYRAIGVSKNGMASMIGKAKKLKRSGVYPESEFKEVKVENPPSFDCKAPIVLRWKKDGVIRFQEVDQLVDFLKKVS